MDFYAEQEKRKRQCLAEIGQLIDEHYQLSHQVESCQKRMAEIDRLVAENEGRLHELDQSQRTFNSYLAVEEHALTLDQLKVGIEAAGPDKSSDGGN